MSDEIHQLQSYCLAIHSVRPQPDLHHRAHHDRRLQEHQLWLGQQPCQVCLLTYIEYFSLCAVYSQKSANYHYTWQKAEQISLRMEQI